MPTKKYVGDTELFQVTWWNCAYVKMYIALNMNSRNYILACSM